jgi:hypothetical protein
MIADKPEAKPLDPRAEVHEVGMLIDAGSYDQADARLATDRGRFAGDGKTLDQLAYVGAMNDAWRRDYAGAAKLIDDRLAAATDDETRAWLSNTLTWIRWAGGDWDGADQANETVKQVGKTNEWLGHYWWDRAYLLCDRAYRAPADKRAAILASARDARAEYLKLGLPSRDPVHVLDAYFAERAGDVKTAVAEALQVSEDWPDLQDAYVLMRAFELDGNAAMVEKLKKRIQAGGTIMTPIYEQQMERDHSR